MQIQVVILKLKNIKYSVTYKSNERTTGILNFQVVNIGIFRKSSSLGCQFFFFFKDNLWISQLCLKVIKWLCTAVLI